MDEDAQVEGCVYKKMRPLSFTAYDKVSNKQSYRVAGLTKKYELGFFKNFLTNNFNLQRSSDHYNICGCA